MNGGSSETDAHLRVLSTALREFAEATTDLQQLLDVVARRLGQVVRDGCVLRLLDEGGCLAIAALYLPYEPRLPDAAAVTAMREHLAASRHPSEQPEIATMLETGVPILVPRLDLGALRAHAAPPIVAALERIGVHSMLHVALRAAGRSLGLLSLVRFDTPEPFDARDCELAQSLADHAALAITNARSLSAARAELAQRERAERELRRVEEQLRHAQKMEAVGRLAAGVAHDFNNVLSVILSYAVLLLDEMGPTSPLREYATEIETAGNRGAALTKQLLMFSRQQVATPRVLDLGVVVGGMRNMMRQLVGSSVELNLITDGNLWSVRADLGQIEQVVVNLVVNARDALPSGGQITIRTSNVVIDAEYAAQHHDVTAGDYVLIAISDTGVGMDADTVARIFEPFFTTKPRGHGTGLGLAIVYGIVKQSRGHVWVYSEPGAGTTFKVYLPRVSAAHGEANPTPPELRRMQSEMLGGNETVLLVEDDDQVRALALTALRRLGYLVIEAANGGEAVLCTEQFAGRIDLLLTDVVLPRMSGRDLAERLRATRPELRVLYMSGHTDVAILQHGVLESGVPYLEKPFTPTTLARKVRRVLG